MATWLRGAVLGVTLLGCSIEGTRQRGDECLQDRECVSPLRCEVTPDGRSLCVTPTRLDAGSPVDAGAADAGPAPVDAPDVPAPMDVPVIPDVPMAMDVRPAVDVPDVPPVVDVMVDSGTTLDAGVPDARPDAAADADRSDAADADDGAG
jgi:hypothetical protein